MTTLEIDYRMNNQHKPEGIPDTAFNDASAVDVAEPAEH